MRLLDLFCGAGGAAMGYHRGGFEVVGVDIKPQPHYPFEFIQADALEFVSEHGAEFDVIHASPPCQRYSHCTPAAYREGHPDLIAATRALLEDTGKPFVIENVAGARYLLREPLMLCGTMFGLRVWRHRYFEIWPRLEFFKRLQCQHTEPPVPVYGHTGAGTNRNRERARGRSNSVADWRAAMDIDWMTAAELAQAIPLAYTKWIAGAQYWEAT
jgi:DNA (cytosine-5)-methyltransferase 1